MTYYQPIDKHEEESEMSLEEDSALIDGDLVSTYRRSWLPKIGILLGAALALVLYSSLVVAVVLTVSINNRRHGARFLASPVNDYISYEPRVVEERENLDPDAPIFFTGKPSEEIDRNWHKLLEYMNVGIPASLMEELGRVEEGIRFTDGTYFATLMVFHQLHCLKNIYHALHPEYYGINRMTEDESVQWQSHNAHCLHMFKQAIMCQSDPMVLTMKWSKNVARPTANMTSPQECVNWDRLMEWAKPRSVDVFKNGVLVHPELGPIFKDGKLAGSPMRR
ncbi:hypothetical protein F4803DRAFT_520353 [Xylaria telfairii]|nr:hypothetical protein F4803DRAFT_520353 [Xylaria telfairii]